MLSSYWLFIPFGLQMLCMAADEFWFHWKRGLPRWERIGHPLDTLTVILCMVWILCVRPVRSSIIVYVFLAFFSCIFVTKDEFVHRRHCSAAEQWLHAVLFLLHPIVLTSAAFLWPAIWSPSLQALSWPINFSGFEGTFLVFICALMASFGVYQIAFWNWIWRPKKTAR
jgi:hypothetical protein